MKKEAITDEVIIAAKVEAVLIDDRQRLNDLLLKKMGAGCGPYNAADDPDTVAYLKRLAGEAVD